LFTSGQNLKFEEFVHMSQHSLYYSRIDAESVFEEVRCRQANDMSRSSHRKKFTFSCIGLFQRLHRILNVQIPPELVLIRLHSPFSAVSSPLYPTQRANIFDIL
jgi:hypothetical protein